MPSQGNAACIWPVSVDLWPVGLVGQESFGGVGYAYTLSIRPENRFLQFHTMAGLYDKGDGVDLGGPIEFRSGIEVGYQARSGVRMGLGVDHRSNAGLYSTNPGLETVHFRVSIPTK